MRDNHTTQPVVSDATDTGAQRREYRSILARKQGQETFGDQRRTDRIDRERFGQPRRIDFAPAFSRSIFVVV